MVELALFFNLEHPIFPVIWSVRRITMTWALLICSICEKATNLQKHCDLSIIIIMLVHSILNLSKEHQYVDQAFLPFQLEASLGALLFCAILLGEANAPLKWNVAAFFAAVALSSRGSFLQLIGVAIRLLISGFFSYAAITDPPNNWDREIKAFCWILVDPLVWVVELAVLFNIHHPILLVIWSVRRNTMTGFLLTCWVSKPVFKVKDPKLWEHCLLSMAAIMILHIILNFSEEDLYGTLGSVLLFSINYLHGNTTEKSADEVFRNLFMGQFVMATFVRAFKRK